MSQKVSKENSKAILSSKSHHSLGLSATPERQYDGFEQILIPRLGSIIIVIVIPRPKRWFIYDFELHNVRVRLTDEEQEKYEILTKKIAAVLKSRHRIEYRACALKEGKSKLLTFDYR